MLFEGVEDILIFKLKNQKGGRRVLDFWHLAGGAAVEQDLRPHDINTGTSLNMYHGLCFNFIQRYMNTIPYQLSLY